MDHREIMNWVFAKLGNEKQLIEYHNAIYKMLGIVIDFINTDGVSLKLSKGRNFNPVCKALRNTENGSRICQDSDCSHARLAILKGRELIYTCHAGFTEVVVPLFDNKGVPLGCMTAGQFHVAGTDLPDKTVFTDLSCRTGLNPDELENASKSAITITREQLSGVIDYLKLMGQLVSGTFSNLLFMESINAPDKISAIQQYIHENYMHPLNVKHIAKKFYFSPNHFSRVFRKTTGTGFNAYLNCYRVEKAGEMLLETDLSVSEIAFLTGFGSISQFNRVFRNITNKTPKAWRKGN